MFESAELGHKIDKDTYDKEVPPLREALLEMRHRLASQRLALLAGTEPDAVAAPRRRPPHFVSEPVATPYRARKRSKANP